MGEGVCVCVCVFYKPNSSLTVLLAFHPETNGYVCFLCKCWGCWESFVCSLETRQCADFATCILLEERIIKHPISKCYLQKKRKKDKSTREIFQIYKKMAFKSTKTVEWHWKMENTGLVNQNQSLDI